MRTSLELDPSNTPEVWQAALRILEQMIVEPQVKVWIQPLTYLRREDTEKGSIIYLQADRLFSANWVKDHYHQEMRRAFSQVIGRDCEIEYLVNNKTTSEMPSTEITYSEATGQRPLEGKGLVLSAGERNVGEASLDGRFIFESFVVGASNQFAHASAVAVAEKPAQQYNPLFLYSSPGLGKTHLLHAIGNHLLARNPKTRVAYLSAECFVNEMIDCLQHHKMHVFRTKYRDSYDMLLIDDIQFIAGKKQTEEEFFHTFNTLYSSKRQIVVTSDRPPKEIEKLEERIRTRFEWGLVADIQPPEIETRIAILKAKAEREDLYVPDDVSTYIATHIKTNVRELEGILIRLGAQASLTGAEISIEMAKHELKLSAPEEGTQYTVDMIQNAVSRYFQIKTGDLRSTTRAKLVALPRQIAAYLIRKYTGLGYREIGIFFGGKDHSTIMHACKKIERDFEGVPETREAVEAIQNLL